MLWQPGSSSEPLPRLYCWQLHSSTATTVIGGAPTNSQSLISNWQLLHNPMLVSVHFSSSPHNYVLSAQSLYLQVNPNSSQPRDRLSFNCCLTTVDPLVLHNDEVDIAGIQQLLAAGAVHHIILSPGPGTPHNPKDIGGRLLLLLLLCPVMA